MEEEEEGLSEIIELPSLSDFGGGWMYPTMWLPDDGGCGGGGTAGRYVSGGDEFSSRLGWVYDVPGLVTWRVRFDHFQPRTTLTRRSRLPRQHITDSINGVGRRLTESD
ncbi:unnamed protein product [Linum trigynum]|uniref:Uncharacterized protein n=1 Tax=Linum trigynum TaxID=586398 RepID=A0AAV2G2K7_9ROSI